MKCTVCIVDDDDLTRSYIAGLLGEAGYAVIEAADAHTATELIEANRPAAILVDVIMPDRDGLELITDLRHAWPEMRIIAISGGGRLGSSIFLESAKRLGADAWLSKPIAREELVRALANLTTSQ